MNKMKLGIMQPYFIPYIGYWQLMNAVDRYVVYDDVNYIKGGWINRNRLLINGEPKYFNVPLVGASPNKRINEVAVNNTRSLIDKNLRTLWNEYRKAPFFGQVYPIMERILNNGQPTISAYILSSFQLIAEYLRIKTELVLSSDIDKEAGLKGQDKVLQICEIMGATEYYNAIGGQQLYSRAAFQERNIQLKFLKTNNIVYKQFSDIFYPNLSIVDVMMFNSRKDVIDMLDQYTLI